MIRAANRAAAALAARPAAWARGLGLVPVRKRTGTNPRSHSEVNLGLGVRKRGVSHRRFGGGGGNHSAAKAYCGVVRSQR